MDDQSLNREIESALNVDPSPEFLAKARTRIAAEPEPSRWRLAWVMVPASALLVIATVMLWPRAEAPATIAETIVEPVAAPALAARPIETINPPLALAVPPAAPSAAPRIPVPREAMAVATPAPFPEIVVEPQQRRAFAALAALIRKGQLPVLPPAGATVEVAGDSPVVEIAPIIFEELPIVAAASTEGAERP